MPASSAPTTPALPVVARPSTSPRSGQRPTLCKRKLGDAFVASPTSLDQVAFSSSANERVISPKKKVKAEDRAHGDLNKWENHVVATIASTLDMDDKDCGRRGLMLEPIAFSTAPVGEFAAEDMQILCYFLS